MPKEPDYDFLDIIGYAERLNANEFQKYIHQTYGITYSEAWLIYDLINRVDDVDLAGKMFSHFIKRARRENIKNKNV